MDYRALLLHKIHNLISGTWEVPEFEREYYRYFLDEIPDGVLTQNEMEFFGLVQEQLDWISEAPSEIERRDGWRSYSEYVEWLKRNFEQFSKHGQEWHERYASAKSLWEL
jgi:hypothetical protein